MRGISQKVIDLKQQIFQGKDHVVPKETPPFLIVKITNGIDHHQFVQLPYGVSKKTYGNLLDDFIVKNYCDIITWDKVKGQQWKIGNTKICGWKTEDLNAYLPKIILEKDILGNQYLITKFEMSLWAINSQ